MTQGIVALDIDGTVLVPNQNPSPMLIATLSSMHAEGWKILFATGRTVAWSLHNLKHLPFPFFLGAFNGAVLFSFPDGQRLHAQFFSLKDIFLVEPYLERFGGFMYEMGGEERIFALKKHFSPCMRMHLEHRRERQKETWIDIAAIKDLPDAAYASLRFFVQKQEASFLQKTLASETDFVPLIMRDSYHEDLRVVQVTASGSSKSAALRYLCKKYPPAAGTIAAGDDTNDIDLLEAADIGIAVGEAPQELRKIAYTTIASPEVLHFAIEKAKKVLLERV